MRVGGGDKLGGNGKDEWDEGIGETNAKGVMVWCGVVWCKGYLRKEYKRHQT